MIIKFFSIIYWFIYAYPLAGDNGFLYNNSFYILSACFAGIVASFYASESRPPKLREIFLFYCIHYTYLVTCYAFMIEFSMLLYAIEYGLFCLFFGWVCLRTTIPSNNNPNEENVILAFYKGEKGSFLMNFFSLFGLPVKSLCVIADNKCLRLRSEKNCFSISDNYNAILNSGDYIIIDSGVKPSKKFMKTMASLNNSRAHILGIKYLRMNCIYGISSLLTCLGDGYKPNIIEYIPSIYLKKCIHLEVIHGRARLSQNRKDS